MPWGVAAAAAGSVISGAMQSSAISGASSDAIDQANKVTQEAKDWYSPYTTAGSSSVGQLSSLLGLNGQDAATTAVKTFQASPGYGYQKSEGLNAIDAGAAAKGMLHSGGTVKAEQTYGDYLANQDYGNYLNRLYGLTTTGLNATSGITNAATGQSTGIQNTLTSGATQQASIYGNTGSGISSAVGTAYKNGLFGSTGSSYSSPAADGTLNGNPTVSGFYTPLS